MEEGSSAKEEREEEDSSSSSSSSSDSSDSEDEQPPKQVPDPLSYLDLRKAFQTRRDKKEAAVRELLKQDPLPDPPPAFSGPADQRPSPERYELILLEQTVGHGPSRSATGEGGDESGDQ